MIRTQLNGSGGQSGGGILSGIGCLLTGFIFLFFGFYIVKWLVIGLYAVAPFIFAAALIKNYKIVTKVLKDHFALFKVEPGRALVRTTIGIVFFPFVALFLLLLAAGMTKAAQFQEQMVGQFRNFGNQGNQQGSGQIFEDIGNTRAFQKTAKPATDGFTDYEEIESEPLNPDEDSNS